MNSYTLLPIDMILRWMLSLVLILMCLFGPSSELKPTQPPVTCKAVRQREGTIYHLSRLDWTPECNPSWEAKNGMALARGPNLHKEMVEELTNLTIKMKECQEYLRFRWQCSNVREEVVCQVNCSLPLVEELYNPQENNTVKWCLTENFCPDKLHFALGLAFSGIFLLAAIFVGMCIWKRMKKRAMKRREEEEAAHGEAGHLMMKSRSDNQEVLQNNETDKENHELIC